jgi:sterol desaturase/sphingolipid hydroxylase (fatty acid hydroxylase superfamily)
VEPLEGAGLFLAGVAFWTLFEYAMHRYLFHWSLNWRPVKWLVYLIHGNHHAVPNDRMRNLMPPIVSLPVASLIWAGCVELLGPPGTWLLLGYLAGYVAYDVVHYACHQWPMSGRLALAIKKHHMRHHHIDEDGNYAISAIFWDRIFGTRIVSPKR